jgi:hypothetical protein
MDASGGLANLNQQVGVQASWIAYLNAFHLMMILTAVIIPLILLARSAKPSGDAKQVPLE